MRKAFWVIPVLLFALGAPAAHADSFTYTFTSTDPSAGFTVTTVASPAITAATVFTSAELTTAIVTGSLITGETITAITLGGGGNPTNDPGVAELSLTGGPYIGIGYFLLNSMTYADYATPGTYTYTFASGTNTLVVSAVPSPEPSTLTFLLTGAGLLGFMAVLRGRNAKGLPEAP